MLFCILLVFILGESRYGCASSDGPHWGYGKTHEKVYGPEEWANVSNVCGTGENQSPVNIKIDPSKPAKRNNANNTGKPLVEYDTRDGVLFGNLTNNGHSPTFAVTKGKVNYKNPQNKTNYELAQFHLHFGCNDSVGSEHIINNKAYSAEMHLVFFNTKYSDLKAAVEKPDGLTVIGVFLKKGNSNVSLYLRKLAKQNISEESSTSAGVKVKMEKLVPGLGTGTLDHYSYKGSLTTPGCFESVNWIVLKKPIYANDFVLQSLRKLKSKNEEKGTMCDNFRPTQRTIKMKG